MADDVLDPRTIRELRAYADGGVRSIDAVAIAEAAAARRLATWRIADRLGLGRLTPGARLLLLLALLLAIVGASVYVGNARRTVRVPFVYPEHHPYAGRFEPTQQLGLSQVSTSMVSLADGRVLGLVDGWPNRVTQWTWDPTTGSYTSVGETVGMRERPMPVLLADGRVLVMGGDISDPVFDGSGGVGGHVIPSTAELFDPRTGAFTSAAKLLGSTWAFSAARLADGRVLVAGGWTVEDPGAVVDGAQLYDPATGVFAATGSLATARSGHSLLLLPDGSVLVVGGIAGGATGAALVGVTSVERYDPATGRFTRVAELPAIPAAPGAGAAPPYVLAPAVALADGRVLVPGLQCVEGQAGLSRNAVPTPASVYDPIAGTVSPTSPMPHCVSTATPLPDGEVFLTGWWYDATGEVDWSGLYDPATGTTRETAAPPGGPYLAHVGLRDGGVLAMNAPPGGPNMGNPAVFR